MGFENVIFDGVVVSNVLHLLSSEEEAELVENVKKYIRKYSVIVVTVHSDRHRSNRQDNPFRFEYFKRYYNMSDLYKLFQQEEFDYLFVSETHQEPTPYDIQFIKEWMTQHCTVNKKSI